MAARSLIIATLAWLAAGTAEARAPRVPLGHDAATAEKNGRAGEAFLAENRAREGVVTLESGLQYRILKAGDGEKPKLDDTVVLHYRGTFVDGTEFGSSASGQPGTFAVRAAIAGFREALQLMPAGSRWQLFVPPHLAYGDHGAGRVIGPRATLIFEAELLSVLPPGGKPAATTAALAAIEVSFRLDPRLTRSLYMGDRWVSPAAFTVPPRGSTAMVEASARGRDASGRHVAIEPEWVPGDPKMVEVTRSGGGGVRITVKRAGETKLAIVSQGVTKELAIKASRRAEGMAVEIVQ